MTRHWSAASGDVTALRTERLDLDPLSPEDADEMVEVLGDASLYAFTGGEPLSLDELRARYESLAVGHSADGSEEWHNWILRRRSDGRAIGTGQATLTGSSRSAEIAWVVGIEWQGQGFAREAAQGLVAWLEQRGVEEFTAHVHPDHVASQKVAARAGLPPTDLSHDGERLWHRRL
jgi:RimJ/RimL family protein N-acetyltransferase